MKEKNRVFFSRFIKEHYGFCILGIAEIVFIIILLIWGDDIYLAINDNLDSNMALYKIYRDNSFWKDFTTPIPMLGGLDRSILSPNYTISTLIYYIFDTQVAFWINYIVALALSSTGFYFLALSINKLTDKEIISPNVLCFLGIFYIFCGIWPTAIIPFSLVPWWAFMVVEICRTKKLWLSVFFVIFEYNISGPLMGIFMIFYTFVFCLILFIKDKQKRKVTIGLLTVVVVCFFINNSSLLISVFTTQVNNIKTLASSEGYIYTDTIKECAKKFVSYLVMADNVQYHAGVWSFRYVALPVVWIFFLLFNFEYKSMKIEKKSLIIYDLLAGAVVINAFAAAFDKCYVIRRYISFLSGFGFSRFMWLSPFFITMAFAMVMHFFSDRKMYWTMLALLIAVPIFTVIDPMETGTSSIYNIWHNNYLIYVRNARVWQQVKWNDFYSTDLFDDILEKIGYDGEWSVAYGIEPCILQYNKIRTVDGYYSNYPIEYKNKWEEMIEPTLEKNSDAKNYWQMSNGQRAYIYGAYWTNPDYYFDYDEYDNEDMLIDGEILKELGTEYVFSRVRVKNASELGLTYLGTWMDDDEFYKISVYKFE